MTCSLCCEMPMVPVVTPCDHIFCRPCIFRALESRHECPNDRQPLNGSQILPISGALKRIWEQVAVKCPTTECPWTGVMGSYAAHAERCCRSESPRTTQRIQDYEQQIEDLKKKNENFHNALKTGITDY